MLLNKTRIFKVLNQAKKINLDEIAARLYAHDEVQSFIIELNTDGQLFKKGVDAIGRALVDIGGEYADSTIKKKQRQALPTGWVTLYDTGDFYRTFKVIPVKGGFEIEANTIKEGEDLQQRWGDELIGLNDESKIKLVGYIISKAKPFILQYILQ